MNEVEARGRLKRMFGRLRAAPSSLSACPECGNHHPDGLRAWWDHHLIGSWRCRDCAAHGRNEDGPEKRAQTHSRETGHRIEVCSGDGEHSYYAAGVYEDHGRTYDAWDVGL